MSFPTGADSATAGPGTRTAGTVAAGGTGDVLDLLGIEPADRDECLALLARPPAAGAALVLDFLARNLGGSGEDIPGPLRPDSSRARKYGRISECDWIEAYLRFAPTVRRWHARRGIPEPVSTATLNDLGRNLAINRRVHGRFGLDTYGWLAHAFAGRLFQLGRLQYLLHRPAAAIPAVGPGEEVLGIHIPEGGSLAPRIVAESLARAAPFFARHFPGRPVRTANCESWLLDPYLAAHLDPGSNVARFAALFTPYGTPRDTPTDAVYFTFRTRSMAGLASGTSGLPRTTALQRLVLDRIAAGGTWQLGYGYLVLTHQPPRIPRLPLR